jgi:TatD DNase family protein
MSRILNIHSHHPSPEALLNAFPSEFVPLENQCYSVGIHPWHAAEATDDDWQRLRQSLHHPQVRMVGECGLDKLCAASMPVQTAVFERQIRLSEEVGKPLLIHCVRAYNEVILLKRKHCPRQPWILHGYRQKALLARQLVDEGFYLSFGVRFQDEAVRAVPMDRLYVETDEAETDIREVIAAVQDIKNTIIPPLFL